MSEQTHILIVDDSAVDRALLDDHLGRDGFDTAFAGDGVEAWSVLDAHPDRFDVVLLDRTMPRMDGLEPLGRIKADHRFLRFTIRDRGNGFEWSRYLDIDPRRAFDRHGRGILMARHISFSSIEFRGTGSEVVATVRCGQPAAAAGGAA